MDQSLNFSMSKDEKLNGNNYPLWSYTMEKNYVKEHVWYVVRENVCGGAIDPNEPAERHVDQSKALYTLTKVGASAVNVAETVPAFEKSYIADPNNLQVTADQVLEANISELASSGSNNPWILDFGANTHLIGEPAGLSHFVSVSLGPMVATTGGPALDIKG
ncbi:unnamed protein product [Calypogeia fissa]